MIFKNWGRLLDQSAVHIRPEWGCLPKKISVAFPLSTKNLWMDFTPWCYKWIGVDISGRGEVPYGTWYIPTMNDPIWVTSRSDLMKLQSNILQRFLLAKRRYTVAKREEKNDKWNHHKTIIGTGIAMKKLGVRNNNLQMSPQLQHCPFRFPRVSINVQMWVSIKTINPLWCRHCLPSVTIWRRKEVSKILALR